MWPSAGKADALLGLCPRDGNCSSYWTMSNSALLPVVTSECPKNRDLPCRVLSLISDMRPTRGSDNSVCPVFTDRTSCCDVKSLSGDAIHVRRSLKLSCLKNTGYKQNYVLEIVPWQCKIKTEPQSDTISDLTTTSFSVKFRHLFHVMTLDFY